MTAIISVDYGFIRRSLNGRFFKFQVQFVSPIESSLSIFAQCNPACGTGSIRGIRSPLRFDLPAGGSSRSSADDARHLTHFLSFGGKKSATTAVQNFNKAEAQSGKAGASLAGCQHSQLLSERLLL